MKCDELKAVTVIDAYQVEWDDNELVCLKSEVDEVIAKLKEEIKKTQKIANEQTFKLCVEKENVSQLEQLIQKQKDKADKLIAFLNDLVRRDLIKDCPTKEVAAKIVKEFK